MYSNGFKIKARQTNFGCRVTIRGPSRTWLTLAKIHPSFARHGGCGLCFVVNIVPIGYLPNVLIFRYVQ
jgi:hypothetical protein